MVIDDETRNSIVTFLKINKLNKTAKAFLTELNVANKSSNHSVIDYRLFEVAISAGPQVFKPQSFISSYDGFCNDLNKCADDVKVELNQVLYPIFVHIFVYLLYKGFLNQAREFFGLFYSKQDYVYHRDLSHLASIHSLAIAAKSPVVQAFHAKKFSILMSNRSTKMFRKILDKAEYFCFNEIVENYVDFTVASSERTILEIHDSMGSLLGQPKLSIDDKTKLYFGVNELDIDNYFSVLVDKGLKNRNLNIRGEQSIPPPLDRIRFPKRFLDEKTDLNNYKEELTDYLKHINAEALMVEPLSMVLYSVLNTYNGCTCLKFNQRGNYLFYGDEYSLIKMFSLSNKCLNFIKSDTELAKIDPRCFDVNQRMINSSIRKRSFSYFGHSAAITGIAPDFYNNFFLSSSQDGNVQLWDLLTHSNIATYKGHFSPIWDVKICSKGFYFSTAGNDTTTRLWTTSRTRCVRVFSGHMGAVNCVAFHPNCNYVASGSEDRTLRIWDELTGSCVRLFYGLKNAPNKILFTNDGKYLVSLENSGSLKLWDIGTGKFFKELAGHKGIGTALFHSYANKFLLSGDSSGEVNIWDYNYLTSTTQSTQNISRTDRSNYSKDLIMSYVTNSTPVYEFGQLSRGVFIATGPFNYRTSISDAKKVKIFSK